MAKNFLYVLPLLCCFAQCGNMNNAGANIYSAALVINEIDKKDAAITNDTTAYKRFEGAWFYIDYPADFTALPLLKSLTSSEGYDSALFTSPDGKIKFYVFSPQWSGNPSEINLKGNEKIINSTASYGEDSMLIKHWTIEAHDKSYRRSYQETKLIHNVNWIIGIEYSDSAQYNQYKNEYIHFKNSLLQFAD